MFFLGRIEGQQHIVKQSSTKMTDADGELFEIKSNKKVKSEK